MNNKAPLFTSRGLSRQAG